MGDSSRGPTKNDRKKGYLQKYQESVHRVRRLEAELEEVQTMKRSISSPRYREAPGSSWERKGGDLSGYAAKLDAIERELIQERYRRIQMYEEIREAVNAVPDETEKDILFYRYIKGMNWPDIAEKLGYTERNVYRLHGRALAHFRVPESETEDGSLTND